MKYITRTIEVHVYTFANIDAARGSAFNMQKVERGYPMTQAEIKAFCEANNNCLCIDHSKAAEKYSLPIDRFISACKEYAEEANSADPAEEDSEDEDSEES